VSINQLHGSDSEENAEKEILFFFPIEQTFAIIKPDAYENKGEFSRERVQQLWCGIFVWFHKLVTDVERH